MSEGNEQRTDVGEIIQLRDTLRFLWESGHYLPFAFIKRGMMTVNDGTAGKFLSGQSIAQEQASDGEEA